MADRVAVPHFAPDDQSWHHRLNNFLTSVVWTRTTVVSTTPYNVKFYFTVFLVDASGEDIIMNLPATLSFKDGMLFIKKIDSSTNNVIIHPATNDTIENVASDRYLTTQGASVGMVSAGDTWWFL